MTGKHRRTKVDVLAAAIRRSGGILIAFVSTKGGAGKSTLAWHIAFEYARWGLNVVIVNVDPQRSIIKAMAVRSEPANNITVIDYTGNKLHQDLPRLTKGADVVIVDVQGRDAEPARSAIIGGMQHKHGMVLIPVEPGGFDIWGTDDTIEVLWEAARLLQYPDFWARVRTVLNRYAEGEILTAATVAALENHPAQRTQNSVKRRTAYPNTIALEGKAVCEAEPYGEAAKEIEALAIEAAQITTKLT